MIKEKMKAIILAGGLGTRISEETTLIPKPMILIGGKPILWHIMKIYSYYGVNEFIICSGYKGFLIKEYFSNYFLHQSDITIDLKKNETIIQKTSIESWRITIVDTGENSMTGGRLKQIEKYLEDDEIFFMTYGDGLSTVNINDLFEFHKKKKLLATMTVTYPPARFGAVELKNNIVTKFIEKPKGDHQLINGGFFVLTKKVLKLIKNEKTIWEKEPLEVLSKQKKLAAFVHDGFWQPLDTMRDKLYLENLWSSGKPPWKIWNE